MSRIVWLAVFCAIGSCASAAAATIDRVVALQPWILPLRSVVLEQATRVEITESRDEVLLAVPTDVLFAFDSAIVRQEGVRAIRALAGRIDTGRVSVTGHTDSRGDAAYNRRLSLRRARSVARVLSASISTEIAVRGMGEGRPVAPNDRPGGRTRNRRVVIRTTTG